MDLARKRVLVVGLGRSGKSAEEFLKKKGCEVVLFDDSIKKTWKCICGMSKTN